MSARKTGRKRGVALTNEGLQKLQAAIRQAEDEEKYGERFTQEALSERVGRNESTIRKVLNQEKGDRRTLEDFFRAFNLQLEENDFTHQVLPQLNTDRLEEAEFTENQSERPQGVPFQVPPLPYYFVPRPEHQAAVKSILLESESNHPGTLVVSAIYGLGGIGKSVLAMAIAHDSDVLAKYSDGVLWATLGQQPDILAFLSHWIQSLGDHSYQPITSDAASAHLRTLLADKRMLLVVDDVWNPEHAELFRVGSSGCCVLVTTREARILQARRYPLDVMSPEQSLELITQKLSRSLNKTEQQQALTFAERVGYLPLALELAASQIEEGVIWTDLLKNFQSEVASLEKLDLCSQDDIPQDENRRKYSLSACFKLSLKTLLPKHRNLLQKFAWLGVVPEDVILTQAMAMTLWQVSQQEAGEILHTFSTKALLVPGVRQAGQHPTYRMHDLMHDFAQKLLTDPQQPIEKNELPGLGLARVDAHHELIKCYQRKTEKGQWYTLPDDGYIHAYLTWHLEQAEQFDQIHQLLQETTSDGRNGWYEACAALGQTASFVTDVARAWRLAKELFERSPARAIALQCRYALINASLNSLVLNFPPELIAVLVETEAWSPAQGLAHIQKIPNPWYQWKSFEELIPYLPDSLLEEALKVSRGMQDRDGQAMAFIYLSTRIPSLKSTAKFIAEALSDPYFQTLAWWRLASQDEKLWNNVLDILPTIRKDNQRASLLRKIVPDLPDAYLPKALEIARQFEDVYYSALAMGAMALRAPTLHEEIRETVLVNVRTIQDVYRRTKALSILGPICTELWPEVLKLVNNINHETAKADLLSEFVLNIPTDHLNEIVSIARSFQWGIYKALVLGKVAKRLPNLWEEALEATNVLEDSDAQIPAVSNFALEVKSLLPLFFEMSETVSRDYDKAVTSSARAAHFPSLWAEALTCIRNVHDVYDRARAFEAIALEMPNLWTEALETIQDIQGAPYQIWVLEDLAPLLPELWPATLDTIQRLWFEPNQTIHLYQLADKLPVPQVSKAVAIARSIQEKQDRILALSAFTSRCPNLLSEIEEEVKTTPFQNHEEHYFALVLGGIALKSPEKWPEVFDAIQNLESEEQRNLALANIASKIPDSFLHRALEITLCIEIDFYRAGALFHLLPHMNQLNLDYNRWCQVISTLSYLDRGNLLKLMLILTKSIVNLGGEDALVETAYAIRDVGQQW